MTASSAGAQQEGGQPDAPRLNQPGKDVQWVPTPPALVEKMLDLAGLTPKDRLVDLGSGDGVLVIAAAQRGARARGIEYDRGLVEFSKRKAAEAGVSRLTRFVRGDIFKTDFSDATVVTTFLLPSMNLRLRPTFLAMKPGTRIVANTFAIADWQPDESVAIEPCERWCTALMWIVPARVGGTWRTPERRPDAHAEVPDGVGYAREGADRERTAARRRDLLHGRQVEPIRDASRETGCGSARRSTAEAIEWTATVLPTPWR